jgi:hypothetical protein
MSWSMMDLLFLGVEKGVCIPIRGTRPTTPRNQPLDLQLHAQASARSFVLCASPPSLSPIGAMSEFDPELSDINDRSRVA